jgi:hypothetical protein
MAILIWSFTYRGPLLALRPYHRAARSGLLPGPRPGVHPGREEMRGLARVSFGLIWTNGLGLLISQCDRPAIVRTLPVDALGVYNAGSAGGRVLGLLRPVISAVYPHPCGLVGNGNTTGFGRQLSRTARHVTVIAASMACRCRSSPANCSSCGHAIRTSFGAPPACGRSTRSAASASRADRRSTKVRWPSDVRGLASGFNTAAIIRYPPWYRGWSPPSDCPPRPGRAPSMAAWPGPYHLAVMGWLLGDRWALSGVGPAALVLAAAWTGALMTRRLATTWFPASMPARLGVGLGVGLAGAALWAGALWWLESRRKTD